MKTKLLHHKSTGTRQIDFCRHCGQPFILSYSEKDGFTAEIWEHEGEFYCTPECKPQLLKSDFALQCGETGR